MAFKAEVLGRSVLAAGIAALVAGCSVPTTYKWNYQQFSRSKLAYAAKEGAMLTDIRGNPFDAPKTEVDATIRGTMYKSHFGPPVPFVAQVPEDHRSPYRVVMLFDPKETMSSHELCTGDPEAGDPDRNVIKVAAAFCAQDIHETSVWGTVPRSSGPDDPEFQALIRKMTNQLFPVQEPNVRDNNNDSGRSPRRRR
ncbi:MAG: hypothetical protein QNI94_12170 [Kiloniellales bacterium]|nr:hypothetical protein [Kiloniellales bacterium]